MEWEIANTKIVYEDHVGFGSIKIHQDTIQPSERELGKNAPILELQDAIVYPALINSHDHLIGTYSPPVFNRAPYFSWLSWDNELKSSIVFSERQMLDPMDLYLLGAYKNIFGGSTTVVDHIPHFLGSAYRGKVPIRVLSDYTLSHSIGSYSLGWGDGPAIEYKKAAEKKIPYITHIGEGLDEESKNSLTLLEKLGALGEFTVLVHGIPFGPKEVLMIKNNKAGMVWCPTSNHNLFREQPPIDLFLDAGINVSIGTDLALAGTSNLLDELKKARKYFFDKYNKELSYQILFNMATANAAKLFRIGNVLGSIAPNKKADLLILLEKTKDPYQNLVEASWEDIIVLTKDGIPLLLDEKLEDFSMEFGIKMEKIQSKSGVKKLIYPGFHNLLNRIYSILGYKKDLAFFPSFEFIEYEAKT